MPSPEAVSSLDFHFDVMCPYAYQTSKWIRAVRDEIGIEINWRFFSLEEVNRAEGKKHPWEREWSYGWSMMRIGAWLRREDMGLLDRWYERAGRALHEDGHKPHDPDVARHLLDELGLDPGIVDAAIADPTTNDEIQVEHQRVIDAGGYGVPTLFFRQRGGGAGAEDHCMFGPVLIDPPTGEAAVRLWNAVAALAEFPNVYEIQKPKTKDDERRIVETFKPYLEARDWVSIDRGRQVGFSDEGFEVVADDQNSSASHQG